MVAHTMKPPQGENDRTDLQLRDFPTDAGTGKDVARAALIVSPRSPGPDKQYLALQTGDGWTYLFSRFENDGERFTYDRYERPDGTTSTTRGTLPQAVKETVEEIGATDPRPSTTPADDATRKLRADGGRRTWRAGEEAEERAADAMTMTPTERANLGSLGVEDDGLRADGAGLARSRRAPGGECVRCGDRTSNTTEDGRTLCAPCERVEASGEGKPDPTPTSGTVAGLASVSPSRGPPTTDGGTGPVEPPTETCDRCDGTDEYHLLRYCPDSSVNAPIMEGVADPCDPDGCDADEWRCRDCHPEWGNHVEHDDGPTGETFRPGEGFARSQSAHDRFSRCSECGAVKTTGFGNNGRSARCLTCGASYL
jgi:hypothetical protein